MLNASLVSQSGFLRRRWGLVTVACAAAVLLIAGIFWLTRSSPKVAAEMKLRQLTSNSFENAVKSGAISPDGKYLAYSDGRRIYMRLVETGEIQAIPPPVELDDGSVYWELGSWYPDCTRLIANAYPTRSGATAYSDEGASLWVVSVLARPPHKLRDNAIGYSVSRDGAFIAFGTNKGKFGGREIWLMGPNGEQAHKLYETDTESAICCVNWSADGGRVLYVRTDQTGDTLLSRDLKGGPVVTIMSPSEMKNVNDAFWLPDGRLLYSVPEPGSFMGSACNFWTLPVIRIPACASLHPAN